MNHLEQIVAELLDTGEHLFYDFRRQDWRFKRIVLDTLAYLSRANQQASTIQDVTDELSRKKLNAALVGLESTFVQLQDAGIVIQRVDAGIKRYSIRVPLFEHWLYNKQVGRKDLILGGSYDRN
jgi:hypothetical protein